MSQKTYLCPGCGKYTSGEYCEYCGAVLRYKDGQLEEVKVEGSDHKEVAEVVGSFKSIKASTSEWSDAKKWLMGIVATLVIGVLGWIGTQVLSQIDDSRRSRISLVSPDDGVSFNHYPRKLELVWNELGVASRYIIEVEIQEPSDGEWYPHPNGSRFVTEETTQSLEFIGAQSGRWRVSGVNADEEAIGESVWRYFTFIK